MTDILSDIIAHKRLELDRQQALVSIGELGAMLGAVDTSRRRSLRQALLQSPTGIIAEFKRRSPSKGWIRRDAEVSDIVPGYVRAGAAALSVLTDGHFFGGALRDIERVRPLVDLPILRKDFIISLYQLLEARVAGADAVLLIAACLSRQECATLAAQAHELGLEVLLEIHSESELAYVSAEVDAVGCNNRCLGTFVTDTATSVRLAPLLRQSGCVMVSESGISNVGTVRALRAEGYRGFLIGERFMSAPQPPQALAGFTSQLVEP